MSIVNVLPLSSAEKKPFWIVFCNRCRRCGCYLQSRFSSTYSSKFGATVPGLVKVAQFWLSRFYTVCLKLAIYIAYKESSHLELIQFVVLNEICCIHL